MKIQKTRRVILVVEFFPRLSIMIKTKKVLHICNQISNVSQSSWSRVKESRDKFYLIPPGADRKGLYN